MDCVLLFFFFSSRRRHTRLVSDWSSDVCSSDLTSSSMCSNTLVLNAERKPNRPARRIEAWSLRSSSIVRRAGSGSLWRSSARQTEIGRASCRERGEGSGWGGAGKKKRKREGEKV